MFRRPFCLLLFAHGSAPLLGILPLPQWSIPATISPSTDLSWLGALALLALAAGLRLLHNDRWWAPALAGAILSQLFIAAYWEGARWGTVPNVLIFAVAVYGFGQWRFRQAYERDKAALLLHTSAASPEPLTEADGAHLPPPVQRYLRFTGVIGMPKVHSARIVFEGEMREKGKDWFRFRSEQHNAFDRYERLFFMEGQLFGMNVPGYHCYRDTEASMQVRIGGLLPVVNVSGPELFRAETVTLLNDMCLLAPAALIDRRIRWEAVDDRSARAYFTNEGVTVSALLQFNERGELTNFTSNDRLAVADGKCYPFSTPVSEYRFFGNVRLPAYGEAVWTYPDGDFVYGRFHLKEVRYNGQ